MDFFNIRSSLGSEFEIRELVPDELDFEKIPGSNPYFVHGPWGNIIFQHVAGTGVSLWDSQYFLNGPIELSGSSNNPVNELHTSLENYFMNDWDGIGLPTEKEGQGGFSHNPFINNKAFFPGKGNYRTFDFHFDKTFLGIYSDAYPKLYNLLNGAENKKAGRIDNLLQLDSDLKVIINHLRRQQYPPEIRERYFHIKAEEFLINALEKMHPVKTKRGFVSNPALKQKAEELEAMLRVRFAEPLRLTELARLVATNVQFIGTAFKDRYGFTIFQYVHILRLEHAKRLLLEFPTLDLEAISIQTNLYDAARLVNAFKKLYGVTPGTFRKTGSLKK